MEGNGGRKEEEMEVERGLEARGRRNGGRTGSEKKEYIMEREEVLEGKGIGNVGSTRFRGSEEKEMERRGIEASWNKK